MTTRTWAYHGYVLEVTAGRRIDDAPADAVADGAGYISTVRVFQAGRPMAMLSPLRFGEAGGRPFETEADALAGGYDAACRIVDDLLGPEAH